MYTTQQRSFVEISKSAFTHNVLQLRALIGPSKIFAPVIKANAYGHGITQIAAWCQELAAIDWMCVALLSDALTLREHGITKPILVIGCIDTDPAQALHKNIHLLVYSDQQAAQLHATARAHNAQFLVHLKIDTGLSRLGFLYTHAVNDIQKIVTLSGLQIAGIYSHFAQSQVQDIHFCHLQIKRFLAIVTHLKNQGITPPYIHMANSAATLRFDIPECNLVRVGAAIYGLWPSQETKLELLAKVPSFSLNPVLAWKSHIMHIQTVPAGSFIGYNCTYQVARPSKIGIIPVGYQDGYDIQFSNTGRVIINNHVAPVVGRICMNHFMVDVTDIPGASVADTVTLVGHSDPVDVYGLAKLSGNNNVRELLTHINADFERKAVE